MKKKKSSYIGGFTANALIVPLGAVLASLMVAIAILTMSVNWRTSDLAELMQESSEYQETATMLQAGTSILSETASSFVQTPVIQGGPDAGSLNVGPLQMYAQEFNMDRRPQKAKETFEKYNVSDEMMGYIKTAVSASEQMQEMQTHAISLVLSTGLSLPDDPVFANIQTIALTEEEQAMPNEARLGLARQLLFSKDYSLLKSAVAQNVEQCHRIVAEQTEKESEQSKHYIKALRTALWIIISLFAGVMVLDFVLFYRWIVGPLRQYSDDMANDRELKRQGGVRELREMATAHNELLNRRNKLESILRAAAETDALTGLPNRYSLERNIYDFENKGALAVFLFDVNFLKKINDTEGHLAGDQLLRNAASCIRDNFGEEDSDNCYRIGGDEFVAILRNCTEADVQSKIESFKKELKEKKISVSIGYGFSENAKGGDLKELMLIADKRMYEHKREIHGAERAED